MHKPCYIVKAHDRATGVDMNVLVVTNKAVAVKYIEAVKRMGFNATIETVELEDTFRSNILDAMEEFIDEGLHPDH